MEDYLQKDIKVGYILGPIKEDPFADKLHTSTLNMVAKKGLYNFIKCGTVIFPAKIKHTIRPCKE